MSKKLFHSLLFNTLSLDDSTKPPTADAGDGGSHNWLCDAGFWRSYGKGSWISTS